MTKSQYRKQAPQFVKTVIEGQTVHVPRKDFSTGTLSYYHSGKLVVNGVQYQVTVQLAAVKSKEWPEGDGQATAANDCDAA
jgi:hypothetical protein